MKRTTIYLEPELEIAVKLQALREEKPMSHVIRDALRAHLDKAKPQLPPGCGQFDSGLTDTGERFEEVLEEVGFGED